MRSNAVAEAAELVDAIAACETRVARVRAEQAQLVARFDRLVTPATVFDDAAREEIAVACRITGNQAQVRLRTSRALACALPGTRAALAAGEIGWEHAVAMSEATVDLDADGARFVEREVLSDERARTPGQVGYRARKAALLVAPLPVEREQAEAAERTLTAWHSLGRADALLDLVHSALDEGVLPSGGDGRRPHVEVVSTHESLRVGAWQEAQVEGRSVFGAQLRALACEADVRVSLVDTCGRVVDQGRTSRVVSAALRGRLDVRDQHCRFPGCEVRARRCRAHHIEHWADGGRTDEANLLLVCDRHHHAVHEGGWDVELDAAAVVHWTSPTGRRAAVRADLEGLDLPAPEPDDDLDHPDGRWIRPLEEIFRRDPPPPAVPVSVAPPDPAEPPPF